jgi:hypothetical protein
MHAARISSAIFASIFATRIPYQFCPASQEILCAAGALGGDERATRAFSVIYCALRRVRQRAITPMVSRTIVGMQLLRRRSACLNSCREMNTERSAFIARVRNRTAAVSFFVPFGSIQIAPHEFRSPLRGLPLRFAPFVRVLVPCRRVPEPANFASA